VDNQDKNVDSIAFNVELSLLYDNSGEFKAATYDKLAAFEKNAKSLIEKGTTPKEFARLSKLLQAIPAVREIMDLYQPINKE